MAWVVVVAMACVVLGAILTLRPFTSIDLLVPVAGLVAIATCALTLVSGDERAPAYRWLVGVGWIVLGVMVLAWPNLTVRALALIEVSPSIVNGLIDTPGWYMDRQGHVASAEGRTSSRERRRRLALRNVSPRAGLGEVGRPVR